jgi:hypothetical protein
MTMRHVWELSDETRKVMTGHVADIAEEANVTTTAIYNILGGTQTDPFAPFEHYYAASVRAGAPVAHWRDRLDAIDARYGEGQKPKTLHQCLVDKIDSDAKTNMELVEALHDGDLSDHERARIQGLIRTERERLDALEKAVNRPAVLAKAVTRINGNGNGRRTA